MTGTARCRSCSPGQPRWRPAASGCSPRQRASPGPRGTWRLLGAAMETAAVERMTRSIGMVGRAVPHGPRRRVYAGKQGTRPLRSGGGGPVRDFPDAGGPARRIAAAVFRCRPDWRVRRHPVGRLPRRDGLGARPEVHRRPAAAAANRAGRCRTAPACPAPACPADRLTSRVMAPTTAPPTRTRSQSPAGNVSCCYPPCSPTASHGGSSSRQNGLAACQISRILSGSRSGKGEADTSRDISSR